MAGYKNFSRFYDLFNQDADYDALCQYICRQFKQNELQAGSLVADLGCGTGELTLRLAQAGYDMIGVDDSSEMLSILSDKKYASEPIPSIFLVNQPLQQLELYGLVDGMVCTFDTLNHIGPQIELEQALARAALFLAPGGVFVFDMNTHYKHEKVLADQIFEFEEGDYHCKWKNLYNKEDASVFIQLSFSHKGKHMYEESFREYYYDPAFVTAFLAQQGIEVLTIEDGESFGPLRPDSERYIFVAKRS